MPLFDRLFPTSSLEHPVFAMEDFANAIAYEVKQEIANRYFGFRTRIESQSKEYLEKLMETNQELNVGIRLHLCRMQFLLQEPRLFCSFLDLAGLPKEYALNTCDRQTLPKGQELFIAMRGEGFTRWRRFRGLALIVYHSLAEDVVTYHDTYLLLKEEYSEICMEIERFQRQNDLSEILSFLRNLDSPDTERLRFLHSHSTLEPSKALEQDLRIASPPPVKEVMIFLNPIPPLKQIKGQFTEILKQAFNRHDYSKPSTLPF